MRWPGIGSQATKGIMGLRSRLSQRTVDDQNYWTCCVGTLMTMVLQYGTGVALSHAGCTMG